MGEDLKLGVAYPLQIGHRLEEDLDEIKQAGVNNLLFAVSEDQLQFNLENVKKALNKSKERFEHVSLDFWAIGGIFGGEASSHFLQLNPSQSQVFNKENNVERAVCPQSKAFKEYFSYYIKEIVKNTSVDEIFIDEPHWPVLRDKNRRIDESVFSCLCDTCKNGYRKLYGEELPEVKEEVNDKFKDYRKKIMFDFLKEITTKVKNQENIEGRKVNVNICIHPKDNWIYGSPSVESIAGIADVISIDPYHFKYTFEEGMKYIRSHTAEAINIASEHNKELQVWVQGFKVPKDREFEVKETVELLYNLGVKNIQFWSYGNSAYSSIQSDDVERVWSYLKESYTQLVK